MTKDEMLLNRRRKGLTQSDLAAAIGYSRQAIIKWERGIHTIPDDVALAVIELCQDREPSRAEAKETAKQQRDREASAKAMAAHWRDVYRYTRACPQYGSHAKTMALLASQGHVIPPCAYAGIVADFPDILTDPNGDHAMSREQSMAAINSKGESK